MSKRSRTERREAQKARARIRWYVLTGASLAVLLVAGGLLVTSPAFDPEPTASVETTPAVALTFEETSTLALSDPVPMVEVPSVEGKSLEEAERLLAYAKVVARSVEATSAPDDAAPGTVLDQSPSAGVRVAEGTVVTLLHTPSAQESSAEDAEAPAHLVVVIDPGHQARSNLQLEAIGPGSSTMKEKVRGGATGVSTRIPEYETVLQIALELERLLEAEGVEVVMTRSTNDVDISNRERAELANQAGADLFVRIHCDGAGDADIHGASTLYPSGNSWVTPIETRSKEAASLVQAGLVEATGATDRGLIGRDDITGFNWSRVPCVLVECGFLSNPVEDKLLSGEEYRCLVAAGIARGVMTYLTER